MKKPRHDTAQAGAPAGMGGESGQAMPPSRKDRPLQVRRTSGFSTQSGASVPAGAFEYYQVTLNALSRSLWPLLALVVFLQLRVPLIASTERLPGLISRSSRLSISGVTVDVERQVRTMASPELQAAMASISVPALKQLMNTGIASWYKSKEGWWARERSVYQELQGAHLIFIKENVLGPDGTDIEVGTTPLGEEAKKLLVDILADQVLAAAKGEVDRQ